MNFARVCRLPETNNSIQVLPFLSFVIFGLPLPLSTILVLCIDIGTDIIPGISLAYEKAELTLMTRRPRNPSKHKLVNRKLVFFSFIHMGIIQTLSGFTAYFLSMHRSGFSPSDLFFARDYFQHDSKDLVVNGRVYVCRPTSSPVSSLSFTSASLLIITRTPKLRRLPSRRHRQRSSVPSS